MTRFRVQSDPDSLEQVASGAVHGRISVEIDHRRFPTDVWTDFVAVILGWWLREAIRLAVGEVEATEWKFMEGPFRIAISSALPDPSNVRLQGIEETEQAFVTVFDAMADINEIITELVRASSEVYLRCKAIGIQSDDVSSLGERLHEASRLF